MVAGIIGLGLMGGSLALSLKKTNLFSKIYGNDLNENHQIEALKYGIVDKIVSFEEIKSCDVIFIGVPVDGIVAILQNMTDIKDDTLIIDLGSTKARIIDEIPNCIRKNLVASHPMTGTEKSGPSSAFDTLYEGKTLVLCNIEDSGLLQQKIAIKIFESLKMNIVYMDAKRHDLHASFISHAPHLISFCLANSVMSQEDSESIIALSGGGFRDMSRIAKSSPIMWKDIFRQNKQNLLISIKSFQEHLNNATQMIEDNNWDELERFMQEANKLHKILK